MTTNTAQQNIYTYRLIELGKEFELFFSKLGQVEKGRQLLTEAFGFGSVNVSPGELEIAANDKKISKSLKELEFAKRLGRVEFRIGQSRCLVHHCWRCLKVFFRLAGTAFQLETIDQEENR